MLSARIVSKINNRKKSNTEQGMNKKKPLKDISMLNTQTKKTQNFIVQEKIL